MTRKTESAKKMSTGRKPIYLAAALLTISICAILVYLMNYSGLFSVRYRAQAADAGSKTDVPKPVPVYGQMTASELTQYTNKLLLLAHLDPNATSTASSTKPWPAKATPPLEGALLPNSRIVAYYGNYYAKSMGVLGQYPEPQMLSMLASTSAAWQAADPSTPVVPAIDYIAVVAQGSAGSDGKYRARMPADQIQQAIDDAAKVHGIVILDVQVGLSNVQTEIPLLEPYLKLPQVHLAIDPEFAMHNGTPPGDEIGTLDAKDINFAAQYLAGLVDKYNLPPKVLIVHRFTEEMVTNAEDIEPLPQVEIVMDMDGWGYPAKKINTYQSVVESEPVQFTGFKLFYKNDVKPPSTRLMTPSEVLNLTPAPSFIQYQ